MNFRLESNTPQVLNQSLIKMKSNKSEIGYNVKFKYFGPRFLRRLKSREQLKIRSAEEYRTMAPIIKISEGISRKKVINVTKNNNFTCLNYLRPSTQQSSLTNQLPERFLYKSHTQWRSAAKTREFKQNEGCVLELDDWDSKRLNMTLFQDPLKKKLTYQQSFFNY